MPEDPDYQPLYVRTEEDIRAAMNAYVNQDIDSDDDRYVDTREIAMFHICTQPSVIQLAQQWDALSTEVGASAFVLSAWGDKLDLAAGEYGVERKEAVKAHGIVTFTSDSVGDVLIGVGFKVSAEQTDPDVDPPVFVTTESATILPGDPDDGSHDLHVEAVDAGVEGNLDAHAVVVPLDSAPGLVSVINANPIDSGADVESDTALRTRTLIELSGGGGVPNVGYYTRIALREPGVGRVTVVPAASGAGTVLIIAATEDGSPVGAGTITSMQARIDPVAGAGQGEAAIDHAVTIATPAAVGVTVALGVTPEPGYTTAGLTPAIIARVTAYINSLLPGDDVVRQHVRSVVFDVKGVYDVPAVTINGVGVDLVITTTPAQVARTTLVTVV